MAIPFLNNINLDDNQLLNAKLHVTSSAPTAAAGQIYFDSTINIETAKYYDGSFWISLVEHTFTNGTFINLTEVGTDATRTLTADLSAAGTPDATKYLRGDNAWEPIAAIPGTYTFDVTADAGTNQTIDSGNILDIAGGTNINTAVGVTDTVTVNLDDSITLAGELIVSGTGQNSFTGQVTIPTTPAAPTDAASKAYVDGLVSGGLTFKGTFRADTGLILSGADAGSYLYNCPGGAGTRIAVAVGDYYVVATAGGSFYCTGDTLDVGDSIIGVADAAADSSTATNWSIVQSDEGVTDISASTAPELLGISLSASTGSVAVGLDIDGLGTGTLPLASQIEIPYVNALGPENRKATLEDLVKTANSATSFAATIAATATVTHSLDTKDVIVQLYDTVTDETVYADVDRISTTQVTITFAATPTNSVRVEV
jgi:hypothetical protein